MSDDHIDPKSTVVEDDKGLVYGSIGSDEPKPRFHYDRNAPAMFRGPGSKEWQEHQRKQALYKQNLTNAGAYDELLGKQPAPIPEAERMEHVTERMLVGSGRGRGGGGGGGKGRTRTRRKTPPKGYNDRRSDGEETGLRRKAPRMCITGLSVGETEYYHNHPGEARLVLSVFANEMMDLGTVPEFKEQPVFITKIKKNFEVWGLDQAQIDALKSWPGLATKKLRSHAWARNGDRIWLRDRDNLRKENAA